MGLGLLPFRPFSKGKNGGGGRDSAAKIPPPSPLLRKPGFRDGEGRWEDRRHISRHSSPFPHPPLRSRQVKKLSLLLPLRRGYEGFFRRLHFHTQIVVVTGRCRNRELSFTLSSLICHLFPFILGKKKNPDKKMILNPYKREKEKRKKED